MRILITGGTGLIGSRLSDQLAARGHEVIHLSRTENLQAKYPAYAWDLAQKTVDVRALEGTDAVVHLAGAGIADARWTDKRKQLIIESRTGGLKVLRQAFVARGICPKVFVSASAIGFYGDSGARWVDESSAPGSDFLSRSCQLWEKAAQPIENLGARLVTVRVGVVLSTRGGALVKMLPSYKFGVGTYFGDGQQYFSWVHIDDVCRVFVAALENDALKGTYNAVAPNPVTNKTLAKCIATAKDQKALIVPAPAFALRLALGEMAAVVLNSNRVRSTKIQATGFAFKYPELVPALQHLVEKEQ